MKSLYLTYDDKNFKNMENIKKLVAKGLKKKKVSWEGVVFMGLKRLEEDY